MTRWPVSAADMPISTVSRSRISPTRMTFGAWRSAARSPVAKSLKSIAHFALVERCPLLRMDEFDGVLESDDMDRLAFIDLVQHRRQRRRLSGAGCARNQNQARLFLGDVMEDRRQIQLIELGISVVSLRRMIE